MSDNEKLAAAMRTRLNFAMVKVQKGWEARSLDQIEADAVRSSEQLQRPSQKPEKPDLETKGPEPKTPRKTHARSDISAAAIGRTVGQSPAKDQGAGGVRSADSSPRVSQASFAVQPHPAAANTGLGLSIPTSPTPRRRPSKRGHRRSTSDILHNSTGGVSGVFKVDKPQERPWQAHVQTGYSPQKYHVPLQQQQPTGTYSQSHPQSHPPSHSQQPPTHPHPHIYPPPPPPPPTHYYPPHSPTVTSSGMVQHPPPHALGQAFQPQAPQQPPQRQYNYTHAPPYSSSPPAQYNNGHFVQSHSPTRPSPLHAAPVTQGPPQGPPQTPPTSTPTSASGSSRPTLAPLHVSLPPISTSINSPTSAPDRVTLPPMRAMNLYTESPMPYGDVTSPRAHLPSPAPHSPGQREVDDDAAESLMYFSSPRR